MSTPEELETHKIARQVRLDKHGLPLSPQPADDPEDPLNWALWVKIVVLLQVALLGGLGTLNTAIINPAYNLFAPEFGITTVQASYQTTTVIAINGIAPFLFIPIANTYGRRPVYVCTTFLGFASALGCAFARNYGQLIGARVVNGLFPVAFSLGAATVCDLFCLHERGRAMGVYTVLTATGGHVAPILGGLFGQFFGWRWVFKFVAILDAGFFVVILFCLPETLYLHPRPVDPTMSATRDELTSREVNDPDRTVTKEVDHIQGSTSALTYTPVVLQSRFDRYRHRMRLRVGAAGPNLRIQDFVWPSIRMMKYPSVLFPALYYATQYGFGSILPAVTVTHIFSTHFGWDTLQIGLAYGGALTIGGLAGESAGGWVVDHLMDRARRAKMHDKQDDGVDNTPPSESRLQAIWTGEILVPIGLLLYGFGIQFNLPWPVPIVSIGIAMFGVQCITTVCYTYSNECYPSQAPVISQLFNLIRQEVGMTFAFYAIPLAEAMHGYHWLFILFTGLGSVLCFLPILLLMRYGARVREYMK